MVVTCPPGGYKENLRLAVQEIDLATLGIEGMGARRAVTDAHIFEIGGPDHASKADAPAKRLDEVFAGREGVRI